MKMPILLFVFFVLSSVTSVLAQTRHGGVDLDVIGFYRDSGKIKLEVYYSFLQKDIKLKEIEANRWSATIAAKVTLFQDGKLLVTQPIKKPLTLTGTKSDIDKTGQQYIIDAISFVVENSHSTLVVLEIDLQDSSGNIYTEKIEKRINLPIRKHGESTFGGILLGSDMLKTDRNESPFEKLGYYFTVNPSNTFGGDYTNLCLYTELSISDSLFKSTDSILITTQILDPMSNVMYKRSQRVLAQAPITPYLASLSVDGLPGDSYYLTISAESNIHQIAKIQKVFYVESDMIVSEEGQDENIVQYDEENLFQSSEISKMNDAELTDKIAQASYVLRDDLRKSLLNTKELVTRQRIFFDYWRKQDQPHVRPLSSYSEYYARVDFANQKYSYQKTLGWKTDRGRVFIVYGAPDKVESELFSTQAKPYMQWQYIGRGYRLTEGSRGFFYFVDKMGGGNFVLVHSNILGEVSNPNWYTMDALQIK